MTASRMNKFVLLIQLISLWIGSSVLAQTAEENDNFLLRRPLNTMQIRLLGTYDPLQRNELLEALKTIVEDAMFHTLVGYFVPTDKYFFDDDTNNTTMDSLNTTNATDYNTTNETVINTKQDALENATLLPKLWQESILSRVFIDWTSTNFSVGGDPFVHVLQAAGTLGFNQYDYVLLHPQTILPLQEMVMSGNNVSTPISLPKMELGLRRQQFFFQILQFIMLENTAEEVGVLAPPPELEDIDLNRGGDDDDDGTINNGNSNSNSTHITVPTFDEEDEDYDDDDDYNDPLPVDQETIGIALIVTCSISAVALFLFVWYVCVKTKQIKKNRELRKESVSKKTLDSGSESDGHRTKKTNLENMSLNPASSGTLSSATSSPTNHADVEATGSSKQEDGTAKSDTNVVATNGEQEQLLDKSLESCRWSSLVGLSSVNGEGEKKEIEGECWQLPSCHPKDTTSPEKLEYKDLYHL